ncbi:MAG: hypothetical protein WCF84_09945 [Anaerolineae bacterium]
MRFCLTLICLVLAFLVACSSPSLPTPAASAVAVAVTPTSSPTQPPPTPVATQTPLLVISLITPTSVPTQPPPTETLTFTVPLGTPPPTSLPELGTTAADAALVNILQRCWQVSDPRQLNGNLPAHRDAFECARSAFLDLARANPHYALVHRLLAWGYFYKDNNTAQAAAEYRTAAEIYHSVGDPAGESEARMRLGLLLIASSRSQGCSEFSLAANLYPANDRASQYYTAYTCDKATAGAGPGGGGPIAPPPPPNISLDEVRGKILFKSDRGYEGYYVMNPDGSNVKPASAAVYKAAAKWEAFSPDHQQVAVVRLDGFTKKFGYDNNIWVTDPQGGGGRALANPADDYDPVWSPLGLFDGINWLAFVSNRGDLAHGDTQGEELWVMHPDGTNPLRITCHGPDYSKHPSWSPDARQLVFYSNHPGGRSTQIYVLDMTGLGVGNDACAVGETARNLSNNGFNDSDPIWVK